LAGSKERKNKMVMGLKNDTKTTDKKVDNKDSAKAEADELLKQMQEKEDSGDCAFC
jgi:hypothetical protein